MDDITTKSDFCIIGGTAVGPKTAATLARRLPSASIVLFEKSDCLSYATCGLPYFASGDIAGLEELTKTSYGVVRSADFFLDAKMFKVFMGTEVVAINRKNKSITVKMAKSGETVEHHYGKLILATGAIPRKLDLSVPDSPNIRSFTRPGDAIDFRSKAEKGKIGKAVIVGAGLIGCELAEATGGLWGIETVLLEKKSQVLPNSLDPEMAAIVRQELIDNDVEVVTDATITQINLSSSGNPVIDLSDRDAITADYAFLCLGVMPEVTLARECGLLIGSAGGISVNGILQTSDPDIFAGGDCIECTHLIKGGKIFFPMGSLANRHGRTIAENLAGNRTVFAGVLGSLLVKIFTLNVGAVGLTQTAAMEAKFNAAAVWGSFTDKPDYYPESKTFTLKMVYARDDMRLLGIQAVGAGDICRRIDLFSSLLQRQAKVDDIFDFEHGYAPPYAEALDPLHHLAAMAVAQERGINFLNPGFDSGPEAQYLDVRESDEAAAEPFSIAGNGIKGRILNMPLCTLANRFNELDKSMKIVLVCHRGPRAYQAAIMLKRAGFNDVHVLGGGIQAVRWRIPK